MTRVLLFLVLSSCLCSCTAAHRGCDDSVGADTGIVGADAGIADANVDIPDAGAPAHPFFEREVLFFGDEPGMNACERDWCISSAPGDVSTLGVQSVLLTVDPALFEVVELTVLDDEAGYWDARLLSPRQQLADQRPELWGLYVELRLSAEAPPDLAPARLRIGVQRVGGELAATATEVFLETHAP
jgi:hypothetical protein